MQNASRAAALLGALARISQTAGSDLPPTDNVICLLTGQTISATSQIATVRFQATKADACSLSHCARPLVSSTNGQGRRRVGASIPRPRSRRRASEVDGAAQIIVAAVDPERREHRVLEYP